MRCILSFSTISEIINTEIFHLPRLASKGSAKNLEITMAALEGKIPYMLQFLGNEDDDVSSAVVDFASEYIAMMKSLPSMSEGQKKHIEVRL